MKYCTYRIIDPRSYVPVYVGQTQDFEKRKSQHLRNARKKLPNIKTFNIKVYLVLLKLEGYDPVFEIVEKTLTSIESVDSETKWVAKTVKDGYPILNRWKAHRSIVKNAFSSNEVKNYFCSMFNSIHVRNFLPRKSGVSEKGT